MSYILVILLVVPFAAAQTNATKKPCCYPERFQAFIGDVGIETDESHDSEDEFRDFGVLVFDYPGRRIYRRFYERNTRTRVTEFTDYIAKKKYRVTSVGDCKECQITTLENNDIMTHCIPEDAAFVGTAYFGFGPHRMPIDEWEYHIENNDNNVNTTLKRVVWVTDGCYLVTMQVTGINKGVTEEQALWMYNNKPILNPELLAIPDECMDTSKQRTRRCVVTPHIANIG